MTLRELDDAICRTQAEYQDLSEERCDPEDRAHALECALNLANIRLDIRQMMLDDQERLAAAKEIAGTLKPAEAVPHRIYSRQISETHWAAWSPSVPVSRGGRQEYGGKTKNEAIGTLVMAQGPTFGIEVQ